MNDLDAGRTVVSIPSGQKKEAFEVSLGYGGYGIQLRYLGPSGTPLRTLMFPAGRARMLAKALLHAADASDAKANGR